MPSEQIPVSVITVCRNAENVIQDTVKSVITQTYSKIEYIIIDGASTDNTLSAIEAVRGNYRIKIVSEPDRGIYDAMNKGIKLAHGEFIYFLNAGDTLYDKFVIQNIIDYAANVKADIIYGNICYIHPDGKREIRKYNRSCSRKIYYLTGDCINHQAMFTRKSCYENELFNITYKICADREWMMRICKRGCRFVSIDMLICNYSLDENSASLRNKEQADREAELCIIKHFRWGYPIYRMFSFMRNNRVLQKVLHAVYRMLYIKTK